MNCKENERLMLWTGLGLGIGAGLMYLLDPERGRRRRALLRDKAVSTAHKIEDSFGRTVRDLDHRARGLAAEARAAIRPDNVVPDDVLEARMHAEIGHRHDVLSTRWSPATRFLMGTAGTALSFYASRESGWRRFAAGVAGAALLTRAINNRSLPSMAGFGGEADGIRLQKTIRIAAPVSEVYEFWANPKNYPKVFAHVQEVRKIGDNLYRWQVAGPAGTTFGWEGTITRVVPNELLEWKSMPGSMVGNWGVARFDPNYDGSTRLHIQMRYEPPAGLLGHMVAEVFGADPKTALDEDLGRLKSLFEAGKTRVHGSKVTRESLKLAVGAESHSPADLLAST